MKMPALSLAAFASISLFVPALAVVNVEWVHVGHAGNPADPASGLLLGAVAYAYNIGKYEVTNAQYTEFLNAVDPTGVNASGIYIASMGTSPWGGISFNASAASGSKYSSRTNMADKPVNYVGWFDAARFANWLHNGQGSGSTETGAYTLNGAGSGIIARNVGATVWLPSPDEWYKAAYYDPTPGAGGGDNYWTYATQSDTAPSVATANALGDVSNPGANVANYNSGADWNGQDGNVTTVGSAVANNYFGTADMAGNVREIIDAEFTNRGATGGAYSSSLADIAASPPSGISPFGSPVTGFRVAAIPEPTTVVITILTWGATLLRRRR